MLRMQINLEALSGRVRQLNIHAAFLFVELPELLSVRAGSQAQRDQAAEAALGTMVERMVDDTAMTELQLNVEVCCVCRMQAAEAASAQWSKG